MDSSNPESTENSDSREYENDYNSDYESNKSDRNIKDDKTNLQTLLKSEKKAKYIPLINFIENNSSADITQKIMIIYGIAAIWHEIHRDKSTKVNITPNYIYLDDELLPHIDLTKLKSDSKKQNADDFLLFNSKFNAYFPREVKEEKHRISVSDDIDAKNKVDIYIYGCVCASLMSQKVYKENDDIYDDIYNLPQKLSDIIDNCLSKKIIYRPLFKDILYLIDDSELFEDLENFDVKRFKNYQKTIVDEEFIQPSTESEFDLLLENNQIQIFSPQDFVIRRRIGPVARVATKTDDESIQLFYKKITGSNSSENKKRLLREVVILSSTNHYAIQKLYGFIKGDEPAILTKYEVNGSLDNIIKRPLKYPNFDFTQKFITMYGIAAGMYYLHSKNIAHHNLESQNIIMNENFEPLICDFGFPKPLYKNSENFLARVRVLAVNIQFQAPDKLKAPLNFYDKKPADVYSFAVLLFNLFTGSLPWKNEHEVILKACEGARPNIPNNVPKIIALLIKACWADVPNNRPTFEVILKIISHPSFLLGVEIDQERFKEYQKKVIDEQFLKNSLESILCNDTSFKEIPKEKVFTNDDFDEVSPVDTTENPFFNYQQIKKDSLIYNRIDIKNEYYIDDKVINHFKTLIQVLLSFDHPTFNPLFGIIRLPQEIKSIEDANDIYEIFPRNDTKPPSLITPFLHKGNLSQNQNNLTITQKFIILYGIAAGMYYLYKQEMTHLNLKPENILLNDEMEPIINIDIISTHKYGKVNLLNFLPLFSFSYVAPELLEFHGERSTTFNKKLADVYSFAMIAYYLMSGLDPWESNRDFQPILRKSWKDKRPKIDHLIQPPFDKLIIECSDTDPLKRPSFKNILNRIGSENFIRSIELLDLDQFQKYQKKVVPKEFIFPIRKSSCSNSSADFASNHILSPEIILTEMIDKDDDPEIPYKLACLYSNKKGVNKDLKKAAQYFEKAANQNHLNAIVSLAILNKKGKGVPPNKEKAYKLIQKAIDKGSIDALVILAKWHLSEFPYRCHEAIKLLEKADQNGHPDAPALLGSLIEKKKVLDLQKTQKDIIDLYKKSCSLGSYEGMYHLATHYHYGIGVEKNIKEAIRLYNLVSKNQNYNKNKTSAIFSLSKLYEENKDYKNAFKLADHFRLKEKFVGYLLCSDFLNRGVGVEVNQELANEYLEAASQDKFINEQLKFSMIFRHGKGVTKNEEEFLKWTKIAAENGSSVAQANLCRYYLNRKNRKMAMKYGKMSADTGNSLGIWNLCHVFKQWKDDELEFKYLQKSTDFGCGKALVYMGLNFKRNNKMNEAFLKFKEAADINSPSGFFHYGKELLDGKLTSRNIVEGLKMLKNAADMGHIKALKKIIDIYKNGLYNINRNEELANQYEVKLSQIPRPSKY